MKAQRSLQEMNLNSPEERKSERAKVIVIALTWTMWLAGLGIALFTPLSKIVPLILLAAGTISYLVWINFIEPALRNGSSDSPAKR
jgi:fatty acid desaturase